MKKFKYFRNCVDHSQREVHLLNDMIDNARDITWKTFSKHCDCKDLIRNLGYVVGNENGMKIQDDYAVSFYKSKYNGKPCYYIRHSAIEYIFIG